MNYNRYNNDTKRLECYLQNTIKCSCGHSVFIPTNLDRLLCTWCGHWVYRNDKIKFKYEFKKALSKNK